MTAAPSSSRKDVDPLAVAGRINGKDVRIVEDTFEPIFDFDVVDSEKALVVGRTILYDHLPAREYQVCQTLGGKVCVEKQDIVTTGLVSQAPFCQIHP